MARKNKVETVAKVTKVKKAEVRTIDVDGVEEVKGGMGFEDGIVLTTFLLLLGSCILLFMALQRYPF